MEKNWTPPLSPFLQYRNGALLCAAFTPDNREVVAVAQDGNLVRWSAADYTPLPEIPLVPDKLQSLELVSSASFSRDAKRILITLNPAGRENGRVCTWSDEEKAYRPSVTTVEFKESIRSLAWTADGKALFVLPARFDLVVCRVFRFEGGNFKERPSIENAVAADLSVDDKWLATAAPGGRVQIWDAQTLTPPPPNGPVRQVLQPMDATLETRYFSLMFSNDGDYLAASSMREPAHIWNVHTGSEMVMRPKSPRDSIIRVAFGPRVNNASPLGLLFVGPPGAMLGIIYPERGDQFRGEPIVLEDAMAVPSFRSDGKALLTLSGAVWRAMDNVRVWDLALPKANENVSDLHFTGKSAPRWLSDVGDAVAGVKRLADDFETPVATLSELKKRYAGTAVPKEYEPIWNRFVESAP
jgi:WD40 repeat protein